MSGTGTSTGDFDDDQKGLVTEPEPAGAAGSVFAEVTGATAMPEEVPGAPTESETGAAENTTDPGDAG